MFVPSRYLPAALALCLCSPFALADAVTVATSGGSASFSPSSDTLSLDATSTTVAAPGDFTIQTGNFYIGASSVPNQAVYFSVQQTITIDGVTDAFTIFGEDAIADGVDTLTIFASDPMTVGGYSVTVDRASFTGTWSGETVPVSVTAQLTPIPEPGPFTLIGSGALAGTVFLKRRRHPYPEQD